MKNTHAVRVLLLALAALTLPTMALQAKDVEDDSKVKTWLTAELLGAMRWAKAESETTKEKLDYTAAELICYKRLQKQIDAGKIKKGTAFIIAENVRKKGIYRDEKLTLAKADELREKIISASIFGAVTD